MKPILNRHDGLNRTEAAYADYLELLKKAGEIEGWMAHPFGLRLADKTFYHPDFLVICKDQFEIHEVKGFFRDDANVKLKVAVAMFPWFQFKLVRKAGKGWDIKSYGKEVEK